MTTLVLLPGMDGTGELFAPFIAALGSGARVQVLRYPPPLTGYADLTHLVQEQLPRHEPFVLLGESFSGPVAVAVAASRPANLIGLVLCCSFVRCPLPFVSRLGPALGLLPLHRPPRWAVSGLLLGRFATPPLQAALSAALAQLPAASLRGRLQAVLAVDVSMTLRSLTMPVLCLRAAFDRLVPASAVEHIARLLPSASVVTLPSPHMLLQAAPSEAAAVVTSFMHAAVASSRAPRQEHPAAS